MTPEQVVEFAEGLARIAASGGGAKALAAYLADATGSGVLVEDAEWRHLAAAGGSVPPSSRQPGPASGETIAIAAGATGLGWLSAYGAPDSADLGIRLRLTASALAVELARESGLGGHSRRRTFWEQLIARTYHDIGSARDDATSRGIALATQYVAIAIEPEVTDETHAAERSADVRKIIGEAFRGIDGTLGTLDRGATHLILVPAAREIDIDNARTAATLLPKTIAKRSPGARITGGVGSVEPLLDIAKSVERAEAASHIARHIYGVGHVAVYDDVGAYALIFGGAEPRALRSFSQRILEPIRTYDDKHQTELEKTLRVYFDCGENVKTAAAQLNVHRHTVFYRLRQISEIARYSLESAHDQLTLRLAIATDALYTD
jgi:sugar diacid utilization regulator